MGQSTSDTSVELRTTEEVGRERLGSVFPWTDLVCRAADSLALRNPLVTSLELSRDEVLLVLEETEQHIRGLTESPDEFLRLVRQIPMDNATAQSASAMVPLDWVQALLDQLPSLRDTRFALVPRHIKEANFWEGYFTALFGILQEALRQHVDEHVEERHLDGI
mmetsp:Transcript_5044/g.13964  ORF Transcript_5044/g.13964 Transcript_5044/m.13964 type:complete len:164 (-) Transcript_5044:258-749(-)